MLIVYMISVQLNETCSAAHTVLYNVENDLRTHHVSAALSIAFATYC